MPEAFFDEKVRRLFGGNSVKAVQTPHQKTYVQGLYILHIWGSTRAWYSRF